MHHDELRRAITANPFEPFYIRTADGRRIPVRNRDFILITPSNRHAYVFQPDDSRDVLDIVLILGLEYGPPSSNGTGHPANTSNP